MPRKPQSPINTRMTPAEEPTVNVRLRRTWGYILLGLTICLFLALISYDWRDISWLCNPPSPPNGEPMNRMGMVGAWLTFYGYGFAGLAYRYFALPLMLLTASFLLHGRVKYFRLRLVWICSLYVVLACLFQAFGGDHGEHLPLLAQLNIRPNAGGALGQWIVTGFLRQWLGSMGLQMLLWSLVAFLLLMIIGVRNTLFGLTRLMTPSTTETLTPEAAETAAALRARNEALNPTPESEAQPSIWKRLFGAKDTPPPADEAVLPSATDLLRSRAQVSGQEWVPPPRKPVVEPLFEPEPAPIPVSKPVMPVAPAPVAPAPKPTPAPTPFTLQSENAPILKPVSPEKAVTAPVPAANDNTTPEAYVADYGLPPIELLGEIPARKNDANDINEAIAAIENVFEQFRIGAKVVNYKRGPVLTQFEIRPEPNVDLKKFEGTRRNLLMNLRAESIRIQAPIPGRDLVGIEVPNTIRQSVTLREILEGEAWKKAERTMELPLALGKLATGGDLIVDLADMPHLLVAGGTGSGKSVAVNDMLVGLLMCRKPDRLRLLMIDPKRVEFTSYDNLPHLLNPVVVEPKKVMFTLRWARREMERRYEQLQRYGVRNIGEYNQRVDEPLTHRDNPTVKLPFIVLIIDELADLMNDPTVRADIEQPIGSLTAKARAAGIHLIVATQRPTTDIITGTIKSNIPGRIALRVAQGNDSRTILDETGAENLIGKGDMLLARGGKPTVRSQAAWVTNEAIDDICNFIRNQAGPAYDNVLVGAMDRIPEEKTTRTVDSLLEGLVTPSAKDEPPPFELGSDEDSSDEGIYLKTLEYIRQTGRFSTSALQRRFKIGYQKAGRITDMLEERGIIGPQGRAGAPREILVDLNADERFKMEGTDGEAPAFDTRTAAAPDIEPMPSEEVPPAEAEPTPSYHYEPLDEFASSPSEDFDMGDLDPQSLEMPEIRRPSQFS